MIFRAVLRRAAEGQEDKRKEDFLHGFDAFKIGDSTGPETVRMISSARLMILLLNRGSKGFGKMMVTCTSSPIGRVRCSSGSLSSFRMNHRLLNPHFHFES